MTNLKHKYFGNIMLKKSQRRNLDPSKIKDKAIGKEATDSTMAVYHHYRYKHDLTQTQRGIYNSD